MALIRIGNAFVKISTIDARRPIMRLNFFTFIYANVDTLAKIVTCAQ